MRVIRLKLSPAQKAKLRKGVSVRLNKAKNKAMEGKGVVMLVHPHKFNDITKAFDSNRGKVFKLDDEELEVNKNPSMVDDDEVKGEMSGSGLFDDIKKGFTKVGKEIKKAPAYYKKNIKDTVAGDMIRKGVKAGSKMGIQAGITALAGTPAAPLVPALTLVNAKYGDKGIDMAVKAIGLGLMAGGSIGEAMDILDDVEDMLTGAGLRAGGDGLRDMMDRRMDRRQDRRQDRREDRMDGEGLRDMMDRRMDRRQDRRQDRREDRMDGEGLRDKIKDRLKDFKPPMRTLPVRKLKGRVGRGMYLGGGSEILGLDAPPATSYIPPSHKLRAVSLLSGISR